MGTRIQQVETEVGILCGQCVTALRPEETKVLITVCYNCKRIIAIYETEEENKEKIAYAPNCHNCSKDSKETNLFYKSNLN